MNRPQSVAIFSGSCRCPSCGHQHPVQAWQVQRAYHCQNCGVAFRIIDRQGRTVPVASGINPAAVGSAKATANKPATDSYQPATATVRRVINCPFCHAEYPFKQALIGRPVRCTSCKGAFEVDEQRKVRAIRPPPGQEVKEAGTPRHTKPPPSSSSSSSTQPAASTSSRRSAKSSPSGKQLETMRLLSKRMNNLAKEALSESTGRISGEKDYRPLTSQIDVADATITQSGLNRATARSTSRGTQRSGDRKPSRVDAKGRISVDTIRTEQSLQAAERSRRYRLLWPVVAVAIGLIVLWTLWPLAAESKVLLAFDSGVSGALTGTGGSRLSSSSDKIIAGGEVQPISNLRRHRLGPLQRHRLTQLSELIGIYRPLNESELWVSEEDYAKAQSILSAAQAAIAEHNQKYAKISDEQDENEGEEESEPLWGAPTRDSTEFTVIPPQPPPPLTVLRRQAEEGELALYTNSDLAAKLAEIPQVGEMLAAIFAAADEPLRSGLRNDRLPQAVEVRSFSGARGMWSLGYGQPTEVAYRGSLLRFQGGEGDGQWRIFHLEAR